LICGRARMCALLASSVSLNAAPMASPDNVRELMQGKFMMVAVPVRCMVLSCVMEMKTVGTIGRGLGVELNVPLNVGLIEFMTPVSQVPVSPRESV